jgi:hypothetical protein
MPKDLPWGRDPTPEEQDRYTRAGSLWLGTWLLIISLGTAALIVVLLWTLNT